MPKVLCTLPNAADEISGIKFAAHEKGMLSEEISDEQAQRLASIPGYELVGTMKPAAPQKSADEIAAEAKDAEEAAERDALLKRAEAIEGFKVKQSWGNDRLRTEVEQAEKKAAAPAGDADKTE